jgi:predicted acylesterase/phospholipase RssA
MPESQTQAFRILSLDGGGAKGFYTLGALREIEALCGSRLCEKFNLIFGTSTGAIIAALLGLGRSVHEIEALYRDHVVKIMAAWLPSEKAKALETLGTEVFGDLRFDAFKTDMGIVGTRWKEERPMIFKTNAGQTVLPFPCNLACYLASRELRKFLKRGCEERDNWK